MRYARDVFYSSIVAVAFLWCHHTCFALVTDLWESYCFSLFCFFPQVKTIHSLIYVHIEYYTPILHLPQNARRPAIDFIIAHIMKQFFSTVMYCTRYVFVVRIHYSTLLEGRLPRRVLP